MLKNRIASLLVKVFHLDKSRFVELFKNCERGTLGGLCSTHARIGWQQLKRAEFLDEGDFYLITGWDFTSDNRIDFKKCKYVTKDRYDMDPKLQLKEGDVLLTKDGTLGKVAYIDNLDKPATLNGHIFVIRPTSEKICSEFLALSLLSEEFKHQMEKNKTGSTIVGVTQKALRDFQLHVPPIAEQKSFIQFAKQLDKLKFESYIKFIHY